MTYQELAEQAAVYAKRIMDLERVLRKAQTALEGQADGDPDDGHGTCALRREISLILNPNPPDYERLVRATLELLDEVQAYLDYHPEDEAMGQKYDAVKDIVNP